MWMLNYSCGFTLHFPKMSLATSDTSVFIRQNFLPCSAWNWGKNKREGMVLGSWLGSSRGALSGRRESPAEGEHLTTGQMAVIVPRGHWSAPRPLAPVPSLPAVAFLIDLEITIVLAGCPETMQAREARLFVRGHIAAQCQRWP